MGESLFAHERSQATLISHRPPQTLQEEKEYCYFFFQPLLLSQPLKHLPDYSQLYNFRNFDENWEYWWEIYEWSNPTALIHATECLIVQFCKLASERTNLKE